jgi:hypothetical protein
MVRGVNADIAWDTDQVEAPVLLHIPNSETVGSGVLVRRMSDARLPFEACAASGAAAK